MMGCIPAWWRHIYLSHIKHQLYKMRIWWDTYRHGGDNRDLLFHELVVVRYAHGADSVAEEQYRSVIVAGIAVIGSLIVLDRGEEIILAKPPVGHQPNAFFLFLLLAHVLVCVLIHRIDRTAVVYALSHV